MLRNRESTGYSIVKNTGQAIWTESEANVINEQALLINGSEDEIVLSNTKFNQIEPFSTGLVTYTLKTANENNIFSVKLGFYVRGERIGDIYNGKIISF